MPLLGPHDAGIHLSRLPLTDGEGNYLAVIEAAAGTRNKCKFEPAYGALVLHKVLPIGTSFPYAFGFLPSTVAEDGDPIDVLVLLDETVAPGTVVPARLIGILQAEESRAGGDAVRNDRLLAVAAKSECYAQTRTLEDVERRVLERIENFFVFYHRESSDSVFSPIGWKALDAAEAAVQNAHANWRRGN